MFHLVIKDSVFTPEPSSFHHLYVRIHSASAEITAMNRGGDERDVRKHVMKGCRREKGFVC